MTKPKYDAPAVRQAVGIIKLLCDSSESMSLAEISRVLEMSKNTALRIILTLVEAGWVSIIEPGPRYEMTLEPYRITSQPLRRTTLSQAAAGHLRSLWQEIDETIFLAVPHHDQVLHVMYFESTREVRVGGSIGALYPIPGGVAASVFLAYASDMDYARMTKNCSGAEKTKLKIESEMVRRQKWFVENSQATEIHAIGSPIFDSSGLCIASAAIMALKSQCPVEKLRDDYGPRLKVATEHISQQLGYAAT